MKSIIAFMLSSLPFAVIFTLTNPAAADTRVGVKIDFIVPAPVPFPFHETHDTTTLTLTTYDHKKKQSADTVADGRWPENPAGYYFSIPETLVQQPLILHAANSLASLNLPIAVVVEPARSSHEFVRDVVRDTAPPGSILWVDSHTECRFWNMPDSNVSSGNRASDSWFRSQNALPPAGPPKEWPHGFWFVRGKYGAVFIDTDAPPGHKWQVIEVQTEVITDRGELNNGLPILDAALTTLHNSTLIQPHDSCGLQIQVRPLKSELDAMTAKRLSALTFLLEDGLLLQLCHPDRAKRVAPISHKSTIALDQWERQVQTDSQVYLAAIGVRKAKVGTVERCQDEARVFRSITSILNAISREDLDRGFSLRDPEDLQPELTTCFRLNDDGAAEFTYPEGSTDSEFIALWVSIARRIVDVALGDEWAYTEVLVEVYELATRKAAAGVAEYLAALDLSDKTDYAAERVKMYKGSLKNYSKNGYLPKVPPKEIAAE